MRRIRRKAARGSAILAIAYLGVVLAGVVGVYFYRTSQSASSESQVRENADAARAVADYAAEMTIANLTKMDYLTADDGTRMSILADFVGINPYGISGRLATERRLGGTLGDYDYRVVVRAVREARQLTGSDAMPDAWLSNVDPGEYNYGVDPVRYFNGAYEIIASARNRAASITPTLAHDTSVRTVVNLSYSSLANSLATLAILYVEDPAGLGPEAEGIQVAGEDHYAFKAAAWDVVDGLIEGLATIKATPSELYSVTNDYWDQGKMTLHYRNKDDVNPMIPRTIGFDDVGVGLNTVGLNQDMTVYDPDRPVDQYLFGGKQARTEFNLDNANTGATLMYKRGRSVTLDENNVIREKKEADAHPGEMTTSALAVGKVENIFKLYLNFVDPLGSANHPVKTATEAQVRSWVNNYWRFQSLGYFSANRTATRRSTVIPSIRPLDNTSSGSKRRWATLIWIKNEKGQFLVRDYYGNYALPTNSTAAPPNEWYGVYRWAWYGGYYSTDKYHFGGWIDPDVRALASTYNYRKNLNTRFLTMEELLGVHVTKGPDGLPAKLENGVVVGGVPDIELDEYGLRKAYDPDGTGTVFNESYQRSTATGDNWGVTATTLAQMPPTDGIYVRMEDDETGDPDWTKVYGGVTYRYKRYKTLEDFAFTRDIADTDAGEAPDERRLTSFHMVLEVTPEQDSTTSEGLYFDMGLTVTLVHPKQIEIGEEDFLKDLFRHWWAVDRSQDPLGSTARSENLTGLSSHTAVSAIMKKVDPDLPEEEKNLAYFRQFGFYEDDSSGMSMIDTMVDDQNAKTNFGRARFNRDGEFYRLDNNIASDNIYYFGRDNLYELYERYKSDFVMSQFKEEQEYVNPDWDDIKDYPELWYPMLTEWRETNAMQKWLALNPVVPQPTLRPIGERFNPSYRNRITLKADTMAQLFKHPGAKVTPRSIAGQAMGYINQKVPAMYAKRNADGSLTHLRTYRDLNPLSGADAEIPAGVKTASFLPGEMIQDPNEDSLVPLKDGLVNDYVPIQIRDNGATQYNARPLSASFVWDVAAEPEDITVTSMHHWPEWFLGTDPEGMVTRDLRNLLLEEYPLEHRGYLGWHREGPNPTVPLNNKGELNDEEYRLVYGDHYEYVIITQRGHMPFETIRVDGKDYLAAIRPDTADDVDLEDCVPKLKLPERLPTFTVSGNEIDGGGILIVNGNLDLRTRLAYHGVVVVLGDLIVTPEKYTSLNEDGKPYDDKGNELSWDGSHYYYLDENGNKKISTAATEWRGELVVQGKLLVGGSIKITPSAYVGEDLRPVGYVDLRGSHQAVNDTIDLWSKVAPGEGFFTDRLGWNTDAGANTSAEVWTD